MGSNEKWLNDRRLYGIVLIVVVSLAIWGFYTYGQHEDYKQVSENQYNRAFYDLVNEVQNVEVSLVKAMIANSPRQKAISFTEVWRDAGMAQANLGQLPISHLALDNTARFLSQVSDYSYTLLKQSLADKDVTQEQFEQLKGLHQYSTTLQGSLSELSVAMGQGRLKWEELSTTGTQVFSSQESSSNYTTTGFEGIETEFKEYPTLIYDGPFSDDLKDIEPKGLTGEAINEEGLRNKVKEFVGDNNVKEIRLVGTTEAKLKTYNFEVIPSVEIEGRGHIIVRVSEIGGHVISVVVNRNVVMEAVSIEQAKKIGKDYLASKGFDNMKDTYYMKDNGIATINYAYTEGDVVIYPDIIKVKVALDDGEVLGFDANGYFMSHIDRKIENPNVSSEQAVGAVNPKLGLKLAGLAIIPTETKQEVLVYEFKGTVDERDFLVYVNAKTGEEEKILIIIDTPNGILTM